jgi:hypothetical protein
LFVVALLWAPTPATADVYYSQSEALALAFPSSDRIDRRSFILTRAQLSAVERLARSPLHSQIVTFHFGWRGDRLLGYALIDVHTVRTLPEALMIVLMPSGSVDAVHVLAFHEPTEYQPRQRWYKQFRGRQLGPTLQLHRGIDAVSGATLSARASTESVRRALALYQVLLARPPKE